VKAEGASNAHRACACRKKPINCAPATRGCIRAETARAADAAGHERDLQPKILIGGKMRLHGILRSSAARYFIITVCALVSFAPGASAFPLVVQSGDTLASIAQRVYGRPDFERLLVSANGLEARGAAIVPGMQLEVPALSHRRIVAGDTWAALAERWLGAPHRAAVLAFANDGQPWVPPPENAEIVIPYNLRFIAEGGETLEELAIRFLGSKKRTWMLQQYNSLERPVLQRGQVVLLPITALPLTAAGQEAAKRAFEAWGSGGVVRAAQRSAASELPVLLADVRGGRYARGHNARRQPARHFDLDHPTASRRVPPVAGSVRRARGEGQSEPSLPGLARRRRASPARPARAEP
jgi:LysM repeat protein